MSKTMFKTSNLLIVATTIGLFAGAFTTTPAAAAPYAKVCNNGSVEGTTSGAQPCPANPKLGVAPTEWGCTLDRGTQLLWEVKATSGLRDYRRNYANYDMVGLSQLGGAGKPLAQIDLEAGDFSLGFVKAVNATQYCGRSNWRRPTQLQLRGLVTSSGGKSKKFAFDAAYFVDLTFPGAMTPLLPTLSSTALAGNPTNYGGLLATSGALVVSQRGPPNSYARLVVAWNNGVACGGREGQPRCPGEGEGQGGDR
jgi:hypothetical protein